MLREDLVAERVAIETYREIVRYFGDKDPTSRVLMETILAKEEGHADELSDLLFAVDPATGHKPQDLYFGDEVSDNSKAGDGIRST
jgi:bacterioferritin (cytochrome b1)